MPVTISIPTLAAVYRRLLEIEVEASTAGEALEQLTSQHVQLRSHLFDDKNGLRSFVNIYVNDEDIRHQSGGETPLKQGDSLMIVPSIAGGATSEAEVSGFAYALKRGDSSLQSPSDHAGGWYGGSAKTESCECTDDWHWRARRAHGNVSGGCRHWPFGYC